MSRRWTKNDSSTYPSYYFSARALVFGFHCCYKQGGGSCVISISHFAGLLLSLRRGPQTIANKLRFSLFPIMAAGRRTSNERRLGKRRRTCFKLARSIIIIILVWTCCCKANIDTHLLISSPLNHANQVFLSPCRGKRGERWPSSSRKTLLGGFQRECDNEKFACGGGGGFTCFPAYYCPEP